MPRAIANARTFPMHYHHGLLRPPTEQATLMNSESHPSGNLRKMQTQLEDVARYTLMLDDVPVDMNARIGSTIKLSFDGVISSPPWMGVCGNYTTFSVVIQRLLRD